jgi:hypothetical protein
LLESHPRLPLPDISRLHMLDLTAPDGIDALAQAILEDWQKRHHLRNLAQHK